jgi:hypothetical protein
MSFPPLIIPEPNFPGPKDVVIPDPKMFIAQVQALINKNNLVSLSLNYTLTGGSFSISMLQGSVKAPIENIVFSLPYGRVGTVKQTGSGYNRGALTDTISGPAVPFQAVNYNFVAIPQGTHAPAPQLAARFGLPIRWQGRQDSIKNFNYRGVALQGIQQLAQNFLYDVVFNTGVFWVVPAGQLATFVPAFQPDKTDVISLEQNIDYSLDKKAVLNPLLLVVQGGLDSDFVYDSDHAIKQSQTTLSVGAPGGSGATDHIDIPNGWYVDQATFEEWEPPPGTDITNPNNTAVAGRYWKVFQSPTNPAMLRGILTFGRLVKDLNLNGTSGDRPQTSKFVGSPVTALTAQNTPGPQSFVLGNPKSENGIYGFTADNDQVIDAVSGQAITVNNAFSLIPAGGNSGPAANNYYTIQYGLWTFPRVSPVTFPVGGPDPTNPFGLAPDVVVVNPSTQVFVAVSGNPGQGPASYTDYYFDYLSQYRRLNSPTLNTTISVMFRGTMPQPGDQLILKFLPVDLQNCGRIESVTLTYSRSGVILNMTARLLGAKAQVAGPTLGVT